MIDIKLEERRARWKAYIITNCDNWFRTNQNTLVIHFKGHYTETASRTVARMQLMGAEVITAFYDSVSDTTKVRIKEPAELARGFYD